MTLIVTVLKEYFRLASLSSILVVFAFGVALLYTNRFARWGRRWLTATMLLLWFLATPAGATLVTVPLSRGFRRLQTKDEALGARTVVLIGGGIQSHIAGDLGIDDLRGSASRVLETARVYRLLGEPRVIVSGGNTNKLEPPRPEADAFKEALVRLGVPAGRISVERESLTTRHEAVLLKPLLQGERFVLVTSPSHMRRTLMTFEALGMRPVPSPAPLTTADRPHSWLVPSFDSLYVSDAAIYDYAAFLYYWARGWFKAT